jgi:hypothetical protein
MIGLVLGGASCLWDDLWEFAQLVGCPVRGEAHDRRLSLEGPFVVIAANKAGVYYPGHVDHWVTVEPQNLKDWKRERADLGYPPAGLTWSYTGRTLVDRIYRAARKGSSGFAAVRVARERLELERIVGCGIPMDVRAHFDRPGEWTGADHHWKRWQDHIARLRPYFRSMSGRTRDVFGAPTPEWLGIHVEAGRLG